MKIILAVFLFHLALSREGQASPVSASSAHPASNLFQAAASDYSYGTSIVSTCDSTLVVTSTNSGDYLRYDDVDFGSGADIVQIHFSNGNIHGYSGTISFHLDSLSGPLLAEVTVGTTDSWCNFYTLLNFLKYSPTGFHSLYVSFTSSTSNLVYLDWFKFAYSLDDILPV